MRSIRIAVTSACNLSCSHCFQACDKGRFELSFDTIEKIIDFAKRNEVETIVLSGGEFFAYPYAYETLSLCADCDLDVLIVTNGTLVDPSSFQNIDFGNRLRIQVSVDGNAISHNRRRGNGTYEKAIQTVTSLSSLGIPITLNMAVDETNFMHVEEVINTHNVDKVNLVPVAYSGSVGAESFSDSLIAYEKTMCALLKSEFSTSDTDTSFLEEISINYDGTVYPSMVAQDMDVLPIGDISEQPLSSIVEKASRLDLYCLTSYDISRIQDCALCDAEASCNRGSRVRAYKAFGDLESPDPLCCKRFAGKYRNVSLGDVFWGVTTPVLRTKRLMLRSWNLDDAQAIVEGLNDEQTAHDFGTGYPYTIEDARAYIKDAIEGSKPKFAIVNKASGGVIGGCGLHIRTDTTSASIWLATSYRGQGFAQEAAIALARYGFESLGIKRFDTSYFEGNEAS